ncbi:nicotinate-nucleotide--dimethylbenzimidazole phosphoribosyltransferase [Tomitella fengzijianii]|uniref:Nicotinate-nucleotide--dimethylbenzimidazole phosphoribosyltransferase n=1 Tax=Tomitella fengzijianii TaxID=2597660 RepID=A0A516X498_9ACTN|nr:nicotinate-nucleotide--dimethylbenzimidazole phosphoribosyltransferase [Tomitella fengzijianii]QDQ97909.1 nicotinate-nucleotide--dimethylbenzimidazole phosphoribosyltransferase [Tomitella fengzijianii]
MRSDVTAAAAALGATFPGVTPPDAQALRDAQARQRDLTKPPGSLGRLEDVGCWVASCQGQCPPRELARVRVVVFAGDHGIARAGVSAFPPDVTAQMVRNFRRGGAAVNAIADSVGAGVRVVDVAVDGHLPGADRSVDDDAADHDADPVRAYKVRAASGRIDREDALSAEETITAIGAGRAIADEEVDAGADLLIAGDMGIGNTTPATAIVATLTGLEPVVAVGRGTGIDDAAWMRKTAAIRDAMFRARHFVGDPVALLRTIGGADLAAMAGFLAQASVRRTPVVLDGLIATAAALVAAQLAPGCPDWWLAGHRSAEPAHDAALERLHKQPLLDFGMRLGEGTGALTAVPVVRAAVATLSNMSTFADAGVSGAAD